MTAWSKLDDELNAWSDGGKVATFWWRDDDAVEVTSELRQLIDIAGGNNVALGLAVIPAGATDELVTWLADRPEVRVLQHGLAHKNHAAEGQKAVELGGDKPLSEVMTELKSGRERIAAFQNVDPILVPPWNRIDPGLFPDLPTLGFRAVSCFAPRQHRLAAPGLAFVNTHLDPHNFKKKCFVGEERAIELLIEHLEARRNGSADPDEATGILTHHLIHPREAWQFLSRLAETISGHKAARWVTPLEAIP